MSKSAAAIGSSPAVGAGDYEAFGALCPLFGLKLGHRAGEERGESEGQQQPPQ